jgi:hypothetical protein
VKNSKFLTRALFIILIVVWGAVGFRVVETFASSSETEEILAKGGGNKSESRIIYHYTPDIRDPFAFSPPHRPDASKKPGGHGVLPPWTPPPLALTGILGEGSHRTAMLSGVGGSVFFLHRGDTLSGVKVLEIAASKVTYLYEKKKGDWTIERQ